VAGGCRHHLAGENVEVVADGDAKKRIVESRVAATAHSSPQSHKSLTATAPSSARLRLAFTVIGR